MIGCCIHVKLIIDYAINLWMLAELKFESSDNSVSS